MFIVPKKILNYGENGSRPMCESKYIKRIIIWGKYQTNYKIYYNTNFVSNSKLVNKMHTCIFSAPNILKSQ